MILRIENRNGEIVVILNGERIDLPDPGLAKILTSGDLFTFRLEHVEDETGA